MNVSYDYTSCITNRANGCNTLQTTMYRYERNQADNTARTNPANYLPNQLQVLSANNRGTFTRTFTFRPSANINGFYLGVQDTGTCGTINRITLYYRICPARRDGLVTFPQTPLPPAGTSQPNTGSGTCAANSSSPTSPIYRAFADGRCEPSASCACNPGFRVGANGERCQGKAVAMKHLLPCKIPLMCFYIMHYYIHTWTHLIHMHMCIHTVTYTHMHVYTYTH